MTKALLSLFTAVFALALAIGSAYAVFTTSTSNGPQTFQAGAIGISNTSASWQQSYANTMSPGDTIYYPVTVANTGNVPLKLLNSSSSSVTGNLQPVTNSSLTALGGGWNTTILPGDTQDVRVSVTMDSSAGNGYMNQTGAVSSTINAESAAH